MAKQSVAKTETDAVIPALPGGDAQVPAYINREGEGRGNETVQADDFVIPRLELAQALSPAVDADDPGYIEGAKAGNLYNTLTRELYGDTVLFVPVIFRKEYLVWRDRKINGGGFAGSYPSMAEANAAIQAMDERNGWEAYETAQHFGLIVKNAKGDTEEVVISMARTKMKVSRSFNSLIRLNGGDRFSRVYVVGSATEKNNNGDSYKNFTIQNFGFPAERIFLAAEKLWRSVSEGEREIVADAGDDAGGTQGESSEY